MSKLLARWLRRIADRLDGPQSILDMLDQGQFLRRIK